MHLHFERVEKPDSYCDCNMTSLSWMGKVPDTPIPKDHDGDGSGGGWKLNRHQYYSEGWLATGNIRGIVGVTYTSVTNQPNRNGNGSRSPLDDHLPQRTNYNLRGHRTEVTLVRWNEPYQKLATCDSSGIIFVWIKYEGRWSIELINDRSTPVTDFNWSHDGRMALICYTDGFVLVGSVTGQRYWSSMLNLDSCHTTCGVWTPDDHHVLFGTSNGHIVVVQVTGAVVTQIPVRNGVAIMSMMWSCEKFKMEEGQASSSEDSLPANLRNNPNNNHRLGHNQRHHHFRNEDPNNNGRRWLVNQSSSYTLAVSFADGVIFLMKSWDDLFPTVITTCMMSVKMEWTNGGDLLAVAGHNVKFVGDNQYQYSSVLNNSSCTARGHDPMSSSSSSSSSNTLLSALKLFQANEPSLNNSHLIGNSESSSRKLFVNTIKFYTDSGSLRYQVPVNFLLHPVTSMTWGHNDKRLFLATGPVLHIAWVTKKVPSLQLLARLAIYKLLPKEGSVSHLRLPTRIEKLLLDLFSRTLRCFLPDVKHLRDYVSRPPTGNTRLYCTLIRHDDDLVGGSTTYVLYLEYLGGLVPILKGKRASKLKPEFVIFDPQIDEEDERTRRKNLLLSKTTSTTEQTIPKSSQSCPSSPLLSRGIFTSLSIPGTSSIWLSASKPSTPILGRRSRQPTRKGDPPVQSRRQLNHPQSSYYWSGSESETDVRIEEDDIDLTDGYGHVYSLPSPIMRRKCRRKRRSPSTFMTRDGGADDSGSETSGSNHHNHFRYHRRNRRNSNNNNNNAAANNNNVNGGIEVLPEVPPPPLPPQEPPSNRPETRVPPEVMKPESTYVDEMPEDSKLLLVTSNIWGTKFKINSLVPWLPSSIGSIFYRTSVLHLQPRQMTLQIKELGGITISRRRKVTNNFRRKKSCSNSSCRTSGQSRNRNLLLTEMDVHNPLSTPTSHDSIFVDEIYFSSITNTSSHGHTTGRPSDIPNASPVIDCDIQETSYAPVAPMTPRHVRRRIPVPMTESNVNRSMSLPTSSFSASGLSGIEAHEEDLLTLQINRDPMSRRLTFEVIQTSSGSNETTTTSSNRYFLPPTLPSRPLIHHHHYHHRQYNQGSSYPLRQEDIIIHSPPPPPAVLSSSRPFIVPFDRTSRVDSSLEESVPSEDVLGQMARRLAFEYTSLMRESPNLSPEIRVGGPTSSSPSSTKSSCCLKSLSSTIGSTSKSSPTITMKTPSPSHSPQAIILDSLSPAAVASVHLTNRHGSVKAKEERIDRLSPSPQTSSSSEITHLQRSPKRSHHSSYQRHLTKNYHHYYNEYSPVMSTNLSLFPSDIKESSQGISHEEPDDDDDDHFQLLPSTSTGFFSSGQSFHRNTHSGIPAYIPDSLRTQRTHETFSDTQNKMDDNSITDDVRDEDDDVCQVNQLLSQLSKSLQLSSLGTSEGSGNTSGDSGIDCSVVEGTTNETLDSGSSTCETHSILPLDVQAIVVNNQLPAGPNRENNMQISRQEGEGELIQSTLTESLFMRIPRERSQPTETRVFLTGTTSNEATTQEVGQERRKRRVKAAKSLGRSILNSPIMIRRVLRQKFNYLDCSSEDDGVEDDGDFNVNNPMRSVSSSITSLMSPSKSGRPRRGSHVHPEDESPTRTLGPSDDEKLEEEVFREFILQNKAPFWNELSQVYQLDFGGRVTQESAKNFQIEHQGNQVMQFGRIDGNAYTLDFQYPFSALQALAVALANVTQRLK